MKARLTEIFVSYQGEGVFLGRRNIFVRFAGCNLSCSWCDERGKGDGFSMEIDNAVSRILDLYRETFANMISFTGGEPLLYCSYIRNLIKKLGRGFIYLLETNATYPERLKRIVNHIDVVSADIKLPQYNNGLSLWDRHIEFFKIASKKKLYVKVVFDDKVVLDDFKRAVDCISSVARDIPLFLQPESRSFLKKRYIKVVERLYNIAIRELSDVRFVPQMHKLLGIK